MRAAILLAVGEPERRATVRSALDGRYGGDYRVVACRDAEEARAACHRVLADGLPVALAVADEAVPADGGLALLADLRGLAPDMMRLLVMPWRPANPGGAEPLQRALTLRDVHEVADYPMGRSDERFHQVVTDLLAERAQQAEPAVELMRVIGDPQAPRSHEIRDLLTRNRVPFGFYDAASGSGRELLQAAAEDRRLPVLLLHDGRTLVDPTNEEAAEALGVAGRLDGATFDVAILGGGPAGLAAAVQASSEGLRTLLVEGAALGGQAGTSSLIRNYLGFPRGLSGGELAWRACQQAQRFGARFHLGVTATGLEPAPDGHTVVLSDGNRVAVRAVIVATGVAYRQLAVEGVERFTGAGVFYGAALSEAPAVSGGHAVVVGAGNSAGQAAVHLARYAERVTMLVRGADLEASMSEYLVAEVAHAANIDVRTHSELVACDGDRQLSELTVRDRVSGETDTMPATAVFVLIGGTPRTHWLPPAVRRDAGGYLLTGRDLPAATGDHAAPRDFETSLPGVFAVGDVRAGSVKRVASAAGESAMCLPGIHRHLDTAGR